MECLLPILWYKYVLVIAVRMNVRYAIPLLHRMFFLRCPHSSLPPEEDSRLIVAESV